MTYNLPTGWRDPCSGRLGGNKVLQGQVTQWMWLPLTPGLTSFNEFYQNQQALSFEEKKIEFNDRMMI